MAFNCKVADSNQACVHLLSLFKRVDDGGHLMH